MKLSPFSISGAAGLRARAIAVARQLAWMRGLRAAVALCTPLVLGAVTGHDYLGWVALGGFQAILADQGGPYRRRLRGLVTLAVAGGAGLALGSLTGAALYWALPVTVLFCFTWTYLSVLGQPFSTSGVLVQVAFICGLGGPLTSPHEALNRGLLYLAGGAWAAALSLGVWPFDPYRPARHAIASCFEELASFLGSVAELSARSQQGAALWHRLAKHHQFRGRAALEQGWQAVAFARASHQAETPQGQQLVVLLENADLIMARTVVLTEHLQAEAQAARPCSALGLEGLEQLRQAALWVGSLLMRRRGIKPKEAIQLRRELQLLPERMGSGMEAGDALGRYFLLQLAEAAAVLESAVEAAARLRLGGATGGMSRAFNPRAEGHFRRVSSRLTELHTRWELFRLRANFTPQSLIFRHAARVALVCGFDVLLMLVFRVNHGYWLLITSLTVLQPHVSGTMRRGWERVAGTVGGGVLAAWLAVVLHGQVATAAILFPITFLAVALMPISFALFVFFLTPTLVLAWLPYSGDWQFAALRMGNTVAGAAIALVAMRFLFPLFEQQRIPAYMRASIAADRLYLTRLAEAWQDHSRHRSLMRQARRAAGLAHNDTEESLDRLMAENWPRRQPFARFAMAFVTYLRRFAQGVAALALMDGEWEWKLSPVVQARLALLERRFAWLEAEIEAAPSATPWPEADADSAPAPTDTTHPGERQLERLEWQSEILRRQLGFLRSHGWLPDAETASQP